MDYPFIHNGTVAGTLGITESGLFTVFELIAHYAPEILRVSVYGDGEPFYLGIPQPKGRGLYLQRRLTRREMQQMPANIRYAACRKERVSEGNDSAGTIWTRRADGTLISGNTVAIPAELRKNISGVTLKIIDGITYMLFSY